MPSKTNTKLDQLREEERAATEREHDLLKRRRELPERFALAAEAARSAYDAAYAEWIRGGGSGPPPHLEDFAGELEALDRESEQIERDYFDAFQEATTAQARLWRVEAGQLHEQAEPLRANARELRAEAEGLIQEAKEQENAAYPLESRAGELIRQAHDVERSAKIHLEVRNATRR